jgi:hypothetical protein
MTKIRKAPERDYDNFRKYFAFSCIDYLQRQICLVDKKDQKPIQGLLAFAWKHIHKGEKITLLVNYVAILEGLAFTNKTKITYG